jgi:signal transduction histidine kinase
MRMRKKVIIIVAAMTVSIFLVLNGIASTVILRSFAALEEQRTNEDTKRTTAALSNEIADVSSKVTDWAFWDDTYVFVQSRNESYIGSNLDDAVFVNLRLSLMLFINKSGQIVYGKAFDLSNNTETTLPQGISDGMASESSLWNHTTTESKTEGILSLPQETLIFSSKPILTSGEEGPIMGALIMGRYIDTTEIVYLSDSLHLPLAVRRFNDVQAQSDFQIARSSLSSSAPIFVRPLNGDFVGGYALVNDVFSNPALILRIDLSRDFYKQGVTTVNFFIAMVAVLCIVFGATMIILLEKGMLIPLSKLTMAVREIGMRESSANSISRFGSDETSILAEAIKDAISQRLAAIEELAGMVGHDLRNPLAGINGAVYYLRTKYESKMDAKGKEMLKIIEDDIAYSDKIVNDLLEYSRTIKLEYVDTTAKALIKESLSIMNIPKNIELNDLTKDETELTVDADKMKRVVVNLIKNAVEAMPQGGSLTIRSMKIDNGVKLILSDTGNGMARETLNKIGSPLFTTKAKGMGFGLSISKRLIEAHGGSISFESIPAKGTTVTILIPTRVKAETKDETWVELPARMA